MKIENKTLIISLASVFSVLLIILIILGVVYYLNQKTPYTKANKSKIAEINDLNAYVHLSVTGTNVNIRAEAGLEGKILTRANVGDKFIAEETLITNVIDNSKWYKIIKLDNNTPLEEDKRFGVAAAYISANFVLATKPTKDDDKSSESEKRLKELPKEKKITLNLEGDDYVYTYTLAVSDRYGYAIYLNPGFELRKVKGADLIINEKTAPCADNFYLRIYEVNSNKPIPKSQTVRKQEISYKRFKVENGTIEVEFNHPVIDNCGTASGVTRLETMAQTIQ